MVVLSRKLRSPALGGAVWLTAPPSASSPLAVRAEWQEVRTKGKRKEGGRKPTSQWEKKTPAVLRAPGAFLTAEALEGPCSCNELSTFNNSTQGT